MWYKLQNVCKLISFYRKQYTDVHCEKGKDVNAGPLMQNMLTCHGTKRAQIYTLDLI